MKPHHEYVHARQLAKHYNMTVSALDTAVSLLSDQLMDGSVPTNEQGEPLTVEELKSFITQNLGFSSDKLAKLKLFIDNNDQYDLLNYTSLNKATFEANKTTSDTLRDNLLAAIATPQVKDKAKLATLAQTYSNDLDFVSPVEKNEGYGRAVTINDLLDASSYVLHDINPDHGTPLGWTDEQKRERVKAYLGTFFRLCDYAGYPSDVLSDVDEMIAVANYVNTNLDITPCDTLGTYIDDHIVKAPAFRRMW